MFTRVAKHMNKILSYPDNLLVAMAMASMMFIMLLVVVDDLGRWLFHSPIRGTYDMIRVSFCVLVWGPMAMAAFKGSHVALTVVLDRLPRLPRLVTELVIALVSSGVLGFLSWRLAMYGVYMAENIIESDVLDIPYVPFAYFGAACVALMALAFLARLPEIVGKIRKEQ